MTPEHSIKFLKILAGLGLAWMVLGTSLSFTDSIALNAFLQVYFWILFDLIFIILLFWSLFFSKLTQRNKIAQSLFFFTFKLVCLGFLAITLKRLRNAPTYAIVMAVVFIGVGPMLAGILNRVQKGNRERG